jgi:hypothetical protein
LGLCGCRSSIGKEFVGIIKEWLIFNWMSLFVFDSVERNREQRPFTLHDKELILSKTTNVLLNEAGMSVIIQIQYAAQYYSDLTLMGNLKGFYKFF